MIRRVKKTDAQPICDIYNYYIKSTIITFEEIPISTKEMEDRIDRISASYPWLVYEENDNIIGYAYATKWRERSAFRYTVESTVYLENSNYEKGIGTLLYNRLIAELKNMGMHIAIGVIALPNDRSVKLHEKLGFTKSAHHTQVGYKFNKWIDVGCWELLLVH